MMNQFAIDMSARKQFWKRNQQNNAKTEIFAKKVLCTYNWIHHNRSIRRQSEVSMTINDLFYP